MGLGTILSLLPWLIAGVVLLGILGFGRPIVEAITRTWTEVAIPLLQKVIASPYGLAVVAGVAFVIWTGGVWYFSDRGGYARAQGECNTTIAVRERDALAEELKSARDRLAVLEAIRLKDATEAMAQAELEAENQRSLDAIPNDPRPCFDEPIARSLWGRP